MCSPKKCSPQSARQKSVVLKCSPQNALPPNNALSKVLWSQKCALPRKMCSPLLVFIFHLDKCPFQSASPSDKCSPWSTLLPKSALLQKKCSTLVLSPQKVPFSKCCPLKNRIPQSALPSKCAFFKVLSSCILREEH